MGKFEAAFKCNIGTVTSADIDDWLRTSGLSPRSRNNLRNVVQTLFSFAKACRYLPKDYDDIESVPVGSENLIATCECGKRASDIQNATAPRSESNREVFSRGRSYSPPAAASNALRFLADDE